METIIPEPSGALNPKKNKQLYRMLWRWHFYAGIFSIPFIIILSITGALYLFKPQIDALHDAPYRQLSITGTAATPEQQVAAALAAVPGATLTAYELPREATDAVNILVNKAGKKIRVYVHPQNLSVLNIEQEDQRFLAIVHKLHGELLLGTTGSILVELAACWAIVLVLTGIYLWWPRNARGLAGVLYPRLALKGRLFWRELHSVIGIWLSFFTLFLLLTGLPWALIWGNAFKEFRQLTGTAPLVQDWNISANEHAHHGAAMQADTHAQHAHSANAVTLNTIVINAQTLAFAYPVLITPPSPASIYWSVKSNAQNRPLRADAFYDAESGALVNKQTFSERHVIDRAVGIGVAAHEGQLFGWFNQLLGLLTALGLVLLSVAGFMTWRKRAPSGVLGAPPPVPEAKLGIGFVIIIALSAICLPVLGASLLVIGLLERLIFMRIDRTRVWLGLSD